MVFLRIDPKILQRCPPTPTPTPPPPAHLAHHFLIRFERYLGTRRNCFMFAVRFRDWGMCGNRKRQDTKIKKNRQRNALGNDRDPNGRVSLNFCEETKSEKNDEMDVVSHRRNIVSKKLQRQKDLEFWRNIQGRAWTMSPLWISWSISFSLKSRRYIRTTTDHKFSINPNYISLGFQ